MENLDFLTKEENEARNKFLEKFNIEKINEIKDDKLPYKIYGNIEHDSMAYNLEFVLKNDFGNISGTRENVIYPIYLKKGDNTWRRVNKSIKLEKAIQISIETKDSINLVDNLIKNNKIKDLFNFLNNKEDIFKFRLMHKYLCVVYPTLFLHYHAKGRFEQYVKLLKLNNDDNNIFIVEKYFWDKYKNNIEDLNMKEETKQLEQQLKENENKEESIQKEQKMKKKNNVNENKTKDIKQPLNQILYGPPGTGKTYNTIIKAMEIIDSTNEYDNIDDTKYKELKDRFDKLKKSGQIEFITFHQSYSYEEFIEGIKPDLGNNTIKYKLEPGILRMICDNAKKIKVDKTYDKIDFSKTRIFKMSLGANWEDETEDIYNYCLKNNVVALGWGGDKDFSQCNDLQDFKKLDNSWGANAVAIFKNWMRVGDVILISNGNSNIKAIAQITGNYEYHNDTEINYCHYRKVNWLYSGDNISISKIYDKKLSQQTIYGFYDEKKEGETDYNTTIKTDVINDIITGNINKLEEKNYVLIIDEINRGNISKIFGELITLIEEDKRIGNEHELKLTLPYSKEPFGIPNNLYIIGTMNTSDRSIASVDIALRRRFKFIEMMPKEDVVTNINIEENGKTFRDIFKALNEKITILLDRDHQIGHSYFLETKINDIYDLMNVWFDEILPLLNEYFYNDWEKLQALLGEASKNNDSFIVVKETKLPFYQYDIEDKVYDFIDKKNLNEENFKLALLKIIEEPKSKQKETDEQ